MNSNLVILMIVVLAAAVSAIITHTAIKLHNKGINGASALEKVDMGITYAQSIAEAIAPFCRPLPDQLSARYCQLHKKQSSMSKLLIRRHSPQIPVQPIPEKQRQRV